MLIFPEPIPKALERFLPEGKKAIQEDLTELE
jgi:hypothetical protein